jgi:excisionase family DNA binding protein
LGGVCTVRVASGRIWLGCPKEVDALGLNQTQRKSMAAVVANELGPMLTASEVAEMLHLHVNTVKRLGDRGELPFYRVCKRGDRRFRLEDVMTFLDRNR